MRRMLVVPIGLLVLTMLGFIIGSSAQLPFVLVLSVLCLAPLFLLSAGFAFGKASNRYTFFVPKETVQQVQYAPQRRRTQPAATYEVGNGDMRGN